MQRVRTQDEFERIWKESEALVCDFSATWCGPCKMLEPVLNKLEKAYPQAVFAKVDIDEFDELANDHGVQAVPTVFFVRRGKVVKKVVGFENYENLRSHAKKLLSA